MSRQYNDPAGGSASQIGSQIRIDHYHKRALIEARRLQYFLPMADVTSMPKHFGKKIRKYHYIPLLDDQNINDQGLDAGGAVIAAGTWDAFDAAGDRVTTGTGSNPDGSFDTAANAWTAAGAGGSVVQNGGNLYGSSKDVGAISGKLPALSETAGRVNRVGFKRKEVEGTIEKFGFFDEYTKESVDFDTDEDLMMHVNREMINGATELTEDALQIDLLNSAGVIRYAGVATQDSELVDTSLVTYGDLLRLAIELDDNRTPKQTRILSGTRMIDTRTVSGGRIMFVGSELLPTLEAMVDLHGERAWIPAHQYAAGTTLMNGEEGSIGRFRIIVVPEMQHWAAAGGDASATATHYETNDRYDVFPMLVIGDGSFTTIGFQTDGKTVKFKIKHAKPESTESYALDPYGETGFMSIKWYYGYLLQRPERIGLIKTTARL